MATWLGVLFVLAVAVCSWTGLGWLVTSVRPIGPLAIVTFYVFAFGALSTTAAFLAWLGLRPGIQRGRLRSPVGYLGHAMLLATISLFALWLQSLRMLTVLAALLLVSLYVFLELALLFGTRGSVDVKVPSRVVGAGTSTPDA